jgi:hypothetical protein
MKTENFVVQTKTEDAATAQRRRFAGAMSNFRHVEKLATDDLIEECLEFLDARLETGSYEEALLHVLIERCRATELSKRETVAAMAMSGMLANPAVMAVKKPEEILFLSAFYANGLIAELDKNYET